MRRFAGIAALAPDGDDGGGDVIVAKDFNLDAVAAAFRGGVAFGDDNLVGVKDVDVADMRVHVSPHLCSVRAKESARQLIWLTSASCQELPACAVVNASRNPLVDGFRCRGLRLDYDSGKTGTSRHLAFKRVR